MQISRSALLRGSEMFPSTSRTVAWNVKLQTLNDPHSETLLNKGLSELKRKYHPKYPVQIAYRMKNSEPSPRSPKTTQSSPVKLGRKRAKCIIEKVLLTANARDENALRHEGVGRKGL
jgi:hypothetical protein